MQLETMTRDTCTRAFFLLFLIRNINAKSLQFGNSGSMSLDPCLSKMSSSCGDSISTRTLTPTSLKVDSGGGGSGIASIVKREDNKFAEHEVNDTELQDHMQLEGNHDSSSNRPPLRISSHKGKYVIRKTRKEIQQQKRIEWQRRKDDKKSHRMIAKTLKNRNHLNLRRKLVHAGFGMFFAGLNHVLPKEKFVLGMSWLTSATLLMELLRYRKGFGWMNDALHFVLGGSLRKHEMEGKFTGSFYYFLGVTVTASCFPTSCASLGICQLALADPSASFFGRQTKDVYWSRIENGFFGIGRNKGVLGFIGGALFCLPFNYRVLSVAKYGGSNIIPGGKSNAAIVSLALGLAGAFADLCVPTPVLTMPKKILNIPMPRFHVDDNVVVPIFSAYACKKIFEYAGWKDGVDLANSVLW